MIEQFGAWGEPRQDCFFDRSWGREPHSIIQVEGEAAGVLGVTEHPDHLLLANLYILPEYQRQGIGTSIIAKLQARAESLPIRLQVLHKNQARMLYARCGFVATGGSDTHFFMD